MNDPLVALAVLIDQLKDWLTFAAAVAAAFYAASAHRRLQRREGVLFDGDALPKGERVFALHLRARNRSERAIEITRIAVTRPRPVVVAIEDLHPPGPGPIDCRFVVPAHAAGTVVVLLGKPPESGPLVHLRLSYRGHLGPPRWTRRVVLRIDTGARLLTETGIGLPLGAAAAAAAADTQVETVHAADTR